MRPGLLDTDLGVDTAPPMLGLGVRAVMVPIMVSQTPQHADVARRSRATNIIQQLTGAIGTTLMSILGAQLLVGEFGVPTKPGTTRSDHHDRRPGHARCGLGRPSRCVLEYVRLDAGAHGPARFAFAAAVATPEPRVRER